MTYDTHALRRVVLIMSDPNAMLYLTTNKGHKMKSCRITGCDSTTLVYSGIDAMLYTVPVETFCYAHANLFRLHNVDARAYADYAGL